MKSIQKPKKSPPQDDDEKLLRTFSIIKAQNFDEKLMAFKLKKKEIYNNWKTLNKKMLRSFKKQKLSQTEIIECLKKILDDQAETIANFSAVSLILNETAVKIANILILNEKDKSAQKIRSLRKNFKIIKS